MFAFTNVKLPKLPFKTLHVYSICVILSLLLLTITLINSNVIELNIKDKD
jgi:hypothetical protein